MLVDGGVLYPRDGSQERVTAGVEEEYQVLVPQSRLGIWEGGKIWALSEPCSISG